MRLDSLGKPPLLQVVQEPKEIRGIGKTAPAAEVKQVTETPAQSSFTNSQNQSKLSQILEILAKNKRQNSKMKAAWAAVQYRRALTYNETKKVGESIDVSG
jgi:hypothetical protein